MDALSELLRVVKLDSAIFFNAEMSEPWCLTSPESHELGPHFGVPRSHLIIYHLLWKGSAYARLQGQHVPLAPGDVVCFPHGDEHILGGGPSAQAVQVDSTLSHFIERGIELFEVGGGGAKAHFICGFLACDPELCEGFLQGLPGLVRVNIRGDEVGHWLENSLRFAVGQATSRDTGTRAMLAKLSEVLFAETLRRYARDLPEENRSWLAGLRDPSVGKALALLLSEPAHPWTLADLSRKVGLSRTVLAERFRFFLGESPMAYLASWRLRLGARALATTTQSVAEIALGVGYESESAFNRAFKRAYELPPARYRRERTGREEVALKEPVAAAPARAT